MIDLNVWGPSEMVNLLACYKYIFYRAIRIAAVFQAAKLEKQASPLPGVCIPAGQIAPFWIQHQPD